MLSTLRKKAKGFTLIELLIVVAIIGILAAIAIPNLLQAQRRSRISRAATDTKQIVTQGQLYINDNNCLPSNNTSPCVATSMPEGLWNGTAPGSTRYMAATYDPFGAGGAVQNYFFTDSIGGTTALTAELRAWSRGPDTANNTFGGDDVGYSSYSGGLNTPN